MSKIFFTPVQITCLYRWIIISLSGELHKSGSSLGTISRWWKMPYSSVQLLTKIDTVVSKVNFIKHILQTRNHTVHYATWNNPPTKDEIKVKQHICDIEQYKINWSASYGLMKLVELVSFLKMTIFRKMRNTIPCYQILWKCM